MDDTLAPDGKHIASLFCQHFNPVLPDGGDWNALKDEAAQAVIDTVTEVAPNFKDAILGMQVLTPQDLEREFSLTGGDIFHGSIHLDQIYSMRPAARYADYRTPVQNLYMCGAGTHPGGGVSGIPGRLSAQEILKDAKKRRAA
jgi:phytoene dehydrogenase-like protein